MPEGTALNGPIRVTQTLPVAQFTRPEGISLVMLALRTAQGVWSWLTEPSVRIEGDNVIVSGTTDHLAGLYRWTDRTELKIVPLAPRTDFANAQFVRGLELASRDARANPIAYVDASIMYENLSPQIIRIDDPRDFPTESVRRWTCLAVGDYTVIFHADLVNFARDNPFWHQTLNVGSTPGKVRVELRGKCIGESPVTVERVCVKVVHERLETFLSFLDFFLEVIGDEEVEYIEVVMENVNDGIPFRLELDPDGSWTGEGGLRGTGPKKFLSVIVHFTNGTSFEITSIVIDALGTDTLNVRFPEQDTFGDCP